MACCDYTCCSCLCGCNASNPEWMQPICGCGCASPYADATGATLVIHKIVLEPCGNQSCTPRNFNIRITGPSYPSGEIFSLRAGSCIELDEPLVIAGLSAGQYTIEEVFTTPHEYITTITGPVDGRTVTLTEGGAPTVVTLVNRKRLCRLCLNDGCGCSCAC